MFYIKEEARGRGVREKYGGEIERKGRERDGKRKENECGYTSE